MKKDGILTEKNGDPREILRIQIFNGDVGEKVHDTTSLLKNKNKDLKNLSMPGYGGEQVYQLLKTGSCEFTNEHFRVSMQVYEITKEQLKQLSQKP